MTFLGRIQRLCPHIFGWSYNDSRRVRFCLACGLRQLFIDDVWKTT